jgi:hypothetical protein
MSRFLDKTTPFVKAENNSLIFLSHIFLFFEH